MLGSWVGKIPRRRKWQPTPVFLPWRIPLDRGAWWATVHGVVKSQTQLSDARTPCFHPTPTLEVLVGFPGSSDGKESACSVGDPCWVHGLGRSPGEGKGYPHRCVGLENTMRCIVRAVTESDSTERLSLT